MKPQKEESKLSNRNKNSHPQTSKEDEDSYESINLPARILHNVEHYQQRYHWDCGVSCVLMVLPPEARRHFLDNFTAICQEEQFGESTWTIDLCYLLKRYNIEFEMYTTMMGVNDNLKRYKYYQHLDRDRARVQLRFEQAAPAGVRVAPGRVSDRRLRTHLARGGPAILLVDNGLLTCDLCKHNKLKYEFRRAFGGSYWGHYILAVGYCGPRVLYRDPAVGPRVCAVPPARLLPARTAPPTDCDVVLIYTNAGDSETGVTELGPAQSAL